MGFVPNGVLASVLPGGHIARCLSGILGIHLAILLLENCAFHILDSALDWEERKTRIMKIIYSGLESSGKSLRLAMMAERLMQRNARWKKKSGIERPIYSNMEFSQSFMDKAHEMGVPLRLWENLDDLVQIKDADVIIDEIGTYFDARLWPELSQDARRWVTQGAKAGIEIYGAAQDFAQVDIAFRRLVNELYLINKVIGSRRPANTKPAVKWIWGVCAKMELDPRAYKEDEKKFITKYTLPRFFLIQRKYCEIFNTSQFIKKSKPLPFKHIERQCERHGAGCDFQKIAHA